MLHKPDGEKIREGECVTRLLGSYFIIQPTGHLQPVKCVSSYVEKLFDNSCNQL